MLLPVFGPRVRPDWYNVLLQTKQAYKEAFATDRWKLHSVNSILAETDGSGPRLDVPVQDRADNLETTGSLSAAAKANQNCLPNPPQGMVVVDTTGNPVSHVSKPETCVHATARGMKILKAGATHAGSGAVV